jgi:hypothetical protein
MSLRPTPLVGAILAADPDSVDVRLADEVVFHSPVRSYRDRADVVHLLGMIGSVLRATPVRMWPGSGGAVTVLADGDNDLEAVLEERHRPDGRVVEVTLWLRPLAVALPTVRRMGTLLDAHPLPSGRPH